MAGSQALSTPIRTRPTSVARARPAGISHGGPATPLVVMACLYLMQTVTRLHEASVVLVGLHAVMITFVLFALTLVIYWQQVPFTEVVTSPTGVAFVLIIVWGVVSIPGATWPGYSFAFLQNWFPQLVMFFTMAALFRYEKVRRYGGRAIVAATVGVSILGFVRSTTYGRFGIGYTLDPNDTAALLVIMLPLVFYTLRGRSALFQILTAVAVLILAGGVIKTGSRGGLLGLAATFLVLPIVLHGRQRTIMIVTFIVGVTTAPFVIQGEFRDRVQAMISGEDYNYTAGGGRMELWKRGVRYMKSSPVFGVGINNFEVTDQADAEGERRAVQSIATAHNSFIQIGAELGFPGLALFIFIILYSLRAGWQVRVAAVRSIKAGNVSEQVRERLAFASAVIVMLFGLMVAGFFLSLAYSGMFLFAFALGNACLTLRSSQPAVQRKGRRVQQHVIRRALSEPARASGSMVGSPRWTSK
jgi:O-antigen ligase